MNEFRDLITKAIDLAPSPGTRQQLVDILEAAGGAAPQSLESGGGGHTDPDHPGGG